jgi:hypothetical protein
MVEGPPVKINSVLVLSVWTVLFTFVCSRNQTTHWSSHLQDIPKQCHLSSSAPMENGLPVLVSVRCSHSFIDICIYTVKPVQSRIARDRIYFPRWPSFRIIQNRKKEKTLKSYYMVHTCLWVKIGSAASYGEINCSSSGLYSLHFHPHL